MVTALWYMHRYSTGAELPIIADSYGNLFPRKEYCTTICKISSLLLSDEVTAIKSDPRAPKLYCLRLERVCGKGCRAVPLQGYMLLYLMPREPVLYEIWYTCIID